jgi:enoyl-CoA hydratase/carnithine racemase
MTAMTEFVDLDHRSRVAVITVNNPPDNALRHGVHQGLKNGIMATSSAAAVNAIVITCAGRTFIAGTDTTEFRKPPQEPGLHEVLDVIESGAKPVIAAIHGTALRGGLEVALACHYQVGVKAARFGLDEVTMGLLPSTGATQRLPRLVGIEKALQMLVSGDMIGTDEALRHGLIDEIVDGDLTVAGVAFAEKVVHEQRPPRKTRDLARLDVGWCIRKGRGEKLAVADRLCEIGRFGQKTGAGYYTYGADRRPTPDPEVEQLIVDLSAHLGITRRPISDEEILQRLLYPMVYEDAKILEEKIAIRASDIDVIWVHGYGWPVYRGGQCSRPTLRSDSQRSAPAHIRIDAWPSLGRVSGSRIRHRVLAVACLSYSTADRLAGLTTGA